MPARKRRASSTMPTAHASGDGGGSLLRELASHNAYFDALVDMMPASLYVSGNTGDEMYNPRYRKGQHKESKEARRARNKAARAKRYDPALAETTREAKRRVEKEEMEGGSSSDEDSDDEERQEAGMRRNGGKKEKRSSNDDEEDDDGSEDDRPTADADDVEEGKSRIEALRARLRAKLAAKRALRPGGGGADGTNADGSSSAQAISKRAARRAEKRKRIEAAKERSNKRKDRSVAERNAKTPTVKMMGGTRWNDPSSSLSGGGTMADDDLAGVDFGGIAGLTKPSHRLDNKSLSGAKKKRSLERLLAEAEGKRKRLEELKRSGEAADRDKARRIEWGETLKQASGDRKRTDDPALLKKALKRKAKKKAKSTEAWKSRLEQTKDKMDERQRIRSHNLDRRKLGGATGANLSKNRIATDDDGGAGEGGDAGQKLLQKRRRTGPHSGKGRAGFEGKKQDFINKASVGGKGTKGSGQKTLQ